MTTKKWSELRHKIDGDDVDRPPVLPSVGLVNWVSDDYTEPCPRCGGGHKARTKYVCSECNRLFCMRYVRKVEGVLKHVVVWRYRDEISRTWCGPVDEAGEWDPIVDRLIEIVEDLG